MKSENEATNAFYRYGDTELVPYQAPAACGGREALAVFFYVMLAVAALIAILCFVRKDIDEKNSEIPADNIDLTDGTESVWQGAFASARISEECLAVCVSIRLGAVGDYSAPSATGIVISSDGWILTADNILQGAQTGRYYVRTYDGREYAVLRLKRIEGTELALMKIDATDLAVAQLVDSDEISAGQSAAAISSLGSPYHDLAIKQCILSGRCEMGVGYQKTKLLRTDITFCDSELGSPIFDREGRVLGIALYQNEKFILDVDEIRSKIASLE